MGKRPISQMSTNPVPDLLTRILADAMPVPPPQEDSDDVSVTNSEVESVMNHRRLKEAMRASAFPNKSLPHSVRWMSISEPLEMGLLESFSFSRRTYR